MASPFSLRSALGGALPGVVLLAFAMAWGNFPGGARGDFAVLSHVLLFTVAGVALWTLPARSLGVGRSAAIVFGVLSIVVSSFASPVPRAGWTALALAPTFLLWSLLVERAWREPAGRAWGLRATAGAVIVVGGWALAAFLRDPSAPAALPLGHHNLLAAFLVPLLPLGLGLWTGSTGDRLLGLVALGAGIAAVGASGSLAGALALASMAVVGLGAALLLERRGRGNRGPGTRRIAWAALGIGTLLGIVALAQRDRLASIVEGADLSARARLSYQEAAWTGFLERPFLGWGPGSTHWTAGLHLRPELGVHPAGQVVADFHGLPLQLLYELGILGVSGLLLLAWGLWPRSTRPQLSGTQGLGALGCFGFAVFSLTGVALDVPAVLLAAATALGAALAGSPPVPERGRRRRIGRLAGIPALLVLALWQLPRDQAHLVYDRALAARDDGERATELLRLARELDPDFPLYTWRLALLTGDADAARSAAEGAVGLWPLWWTAAELGEDAAAARRAWGRVHELDPLGAAAPFRLACDSATGAEERLAWGERALRAEPRLLASTDGECRGVLWAATVRLAGREQLDPGWRERLLELARLEPEGEASRILGLRPDARPSESLSLFSFRRSPWPMEIGRLSLDAALVERIDLGPAPPSQPSREETSGHEKGVR